MPNTYLNMTRINPVFRDEVGDLYRKATLAEGLADPQAVRGNFESEVYWFVPLTRTKPTEPTK